MNNTMPVLVEVRRGAIVESWHRGTIVVCEPDGGILKLLGEGELFTSTRSTIKPIQAIPLITSGAADKFGFTPRELALACASHNGEAIHTETAAQMLGRAGLDERALLCGAHAPYSEDAALKLTRDGTPFTQLHNNCSGKHAGMLATAVHRGLAIENYVSPDHPVQQAIVSVLTQMADIKEPPLAAIDGCCAPTFAVSLRSLAIAFARLVSPWSWKADYSSPDAGVTEASKRIVAAMTSYPEMVGATRGRLDTDLLRAARGSLICKIGAEAVYSIGILPCERFPRGAGVAIKMEDGASRGLGPTVIETLAQLGVLDESQQAELTAYHRPIVKNRRGMNVGEIRAVFDLEVDN